MSDELGDFAALLRSLREHAVEFVVVGGVAVNVHGVLRSTEDLDIVPAPARENLARLAGALEAVEAHVPGADPRFDSMSQSALEGGASVRCLTRYGPLHIVQRQPGVPPYGELCEEALRVDLDDLTVAVCSYRHLVAMKRATGRDQDEIDLRDLRRGRGEADTNP